MSHSDEIVKSWQANADNWISTIDGNEIESRTLVTNAAIVETILDHHPAKVLDIGCGEGWLTRSLQASGIDAQGTDAVESLVRNAIEKGGEHYTVCTYEDLTKDKFHPISDVDTVVINFALLDKENSEQLIFYLAKRLKKNSLIFIQTLHPVNIALSEKYETGWKEGSWNGFKREFVQSYKWYFRTFEAWINLFTGAGLMLKELKEPIHPLTNKPASVIFVLAV